MVDREKVRRGLETHYSEHLCLQCPYRGEEHCTMELAADALALLKEQERVPAVTRSTETPPVSFWAGKTVLCRETPVTIRREVYCTYDVPFAEGYDAEGRYYKFRLEDLALCEKVIEGVVKRGRNK